MRCNLVLGMACLLLVSCLEPTQVTFDITTDIPCEKLNSTSVTVGVEGTTERGAPVTVSRDCRPDGTVGAIGTYAVTPAKDPKVVASAKVVVAVGTNVDVEADCTIANKYKNCVVARRRLSFVPHRNLRVPIQLYLICTGVACEENSTCNRAGKCVSSLIDTSQCTGDVCPEPGDGEGMTTTPATQLSFVTQPSSPTVAGTSFAQQPVLQFLDANDALVVGETSAVTLKVFSDSACSVEIPNALTGATVVSALAGRALFSAVAPTKTRIAYIGAASGSLKACSSVLVVTPGPAMKLSFSVQPSMTVSADAPLVQSPVVQVVDANDNLVPSASDAITIEAHGDATCSNVVPGSFTLTTNPQSAVQGEAQFGSMRILDTDVIRLKAIAVGLQPACSSAIAVQPGAAASLVFATQPSSTGNTDMPLVQQPVIAIHDAQGNVVTMATNAVTLESHANASCTSAVVNGVTATANPLAATLGLAAFMGTTIPKTNVIALKATAAGLAPACSDALDIIPGAVASLSFATQPSISGTAGTLLSRQPVVQGLDPLGNVVTAFTSNVTLTAHANATCTSPLPGSIGGPATTPAVNGSAAFSISVNKIAAVALLATAGPLSRCSTTFNIATGSPSASVSTVATTPQSVVADGATTSTATVTLVDAFGNPVANEVIALTSSRGVLDQIMPAQMATDGNGVAQFAVTSRRTGPAVLTATVMSSGASITQTATVTFLAGAPTQLAYAATPAISGDTDTALAQQPRVLVLDANNNLVPTATDNITLTAYQSTGCTNAVVGGVVATANPLAATNGFAQFAGVTVLKTNVVSIGASSGSLTTACWSGLTIAAGAPAMLTFATQPSAIGTAGSALLQPPVVDVRDANQNLVIAAALQISLTGHSAAGCASPVAASTTSTPVQTTNGLATFGALTVFKTSVTRIRASDGTRSVCSQAIAIAPAAADVATSTLTASPSSVIANGVTTSTVTATLMDAYLNPVPGKQMNLSGPPVGSVLTVAPVMPVTTDVAGVATWTVKSRLVQSMQFVARDLTDSINLMQTASVNFTPIPLFTFDRPGYVTREGASTFINGDATVTVQRDITTSAANVTVQWLPVQATTRFTSGVVVLNFSAGEATKTVALSALTPFNDSVRNGDLFLALRLSAPTNDHAIGLQGYSKVWLVDDEIPEGDFMFDNTLYTDTIAARAPIRVLRAGGRTTGPASVDVVFVDGSARPGSDYTGTSQTVTFTNGETEKLVSIPTTVSAGNRSFFLSLRNPSTGWKVRQIAQAKVRILGTDAVSACDYTNTDTAVNNGFGGGQGTPADPYQICSLAQLGWAKADMAVRGPTTSYVLMSDIDADPNLDADAQTAGLQGFTTLGIVPKSFDGNEHVIWNVRQTVSGQYAGFFVFGCMVGVPSTLKRLNIEHEVLTASDAVQSVGLMEGATCPFGFASPAVRQDNYTSGFINAPLGSELGGLIGWAVQSAGDVANSRNFAAARIIGTQKLGGLIGYNYFQDNSVTKPTHDGVVAVLEPSLGFAGGYTGYSLSSHEAVTDSEFDTVVLAGNTAVSVGGYNGYTDVRASAPMLTNPTSVRIATRIYGGVQDLGGFYGTLSCLSGCNASLTTPTIDAHIMGSRDSFNLGGAIGAAATHGQYQIVTPTIAADLSESSSTNQVRSGWGGVIGTYTGTPYSGPVDNGLISISGGTVSATIISDQNSQLLSIGGVFGRVTTVDFLKVDVSDVDVTANISASRSLGMIGGYIGTVSIKGLEPIVQIRSVLAPGTARVSGTISVTDPAANRIGGFFGMVLSETDSTTGPALFSAGGLASRVNVNCGAGYHCGGIAGQVYSSFINHSFAFTNSVVTGSVAGGAYVGGVVGYASMESAGSTMSISKIATSAPVDSVPGFGAPQSFGSLAGQLHTLVPGTISVANSFSSGSVQVTTMGTVPATVSGFVGVSDGAGLTLTDSYTTSPVVGPPPSAGGFTAATSNAPTLTRVFAYQSALPIGAYGLVKHAAPPPLVDGYFLATSGGLTDAQNTAQPAAFFQTNSIPGWDFTTTWQYVNGQYPTLRASPTF